MYYMGTAFGRDVHDFPGLGYKMSAGMFRKREVPDYPGLDNDGPMLSVGFFYKDVKKAKYDAWHAEEDKAEKVQFQAFTKVDSSLPMIWYIRKDRLNRCPIFQALFFGRDPNWIPQWNEIQPILPFVSDAKEMYHLLHWINRDALVSPSVIPLTRCLELAKNYGIINNGIIPELEKLNKI